jgi:hypothetical protein
MEQIAELNTNTLMETTGRSRPPRRLDPIRLSPPDAAIIAVGLGWIAANHDLWKTKRQMPFARPELRWLPQTFDRGRYSKELMQRLLDAMSSVLQIRGNGGRLYNLDPFQCAGLILAVRVIVQRVSHGHATSPASDLGRRAKRLIKRLEAYRKRTKRAFIHQRGAVAYQAKESEWQALVRWLRLYLLDCQCKRRRRFRLTRHLRTTVQVLFEWAKAELIERREKVPPDAELRKLVRLALRYVRRGRRDFGVGQLLKDRVFASAHLANFVTLRMEKQSKLKDKEIANK